MSPFIVTTRQIQPGTTLRENKPIMSHAAATIEQARQFAEREIEGTPALAVDEVRLLREAGDLTDAGGTVGPLTDGTVIEVRPVEWNALRGLVGLPAIHTMNDGTDQETLDAFNERSH